MSERGHVQVLALCTGNAARSVMAAAMLSGAGIPVVSAGTHVVEGQPMSRRTRDALAAHEIAVPGHRSRQLTDEDVATADLVLAMASEHVAYVRRRHPAAAPRTATIRRLCRDLPDGPRPLTERLAELELDSVALEPWEDVEDPAGGEDEAYVACADTLLALTAELAPRLR